MKEKHILLTILLLATLITAQGALNLEIELPAQYKENKPGEKIVFTMKILHVAQEERKDITLEYGLRTNNKIITTKKETVAIGTQGSFVGEITTPSTIQEGNYELYAKILPLVGVNEGTESSITVHIQKETTIQEHIKNYKTTILLLLGGILTLTLLLTFRKTIKKGLQHRTTRKKIRKLIKNKIKKEEITNEELQQSTLPQETKRNNNEEKIY